MSLSTLPELLFDRAEKMPDRPAICEKGEQFSYAQLSKKVKKTAHCLQNSGFQPGDRFAIWAPNSAAWIIAALAGQAAGGTLVTLNSRFKGSEAADILRRSRCKILFTVKGFLGSDYLDLLKDESLPDLQHKILLEENGDGTPFTRFLARGDAEKFKLAAHGGGISDIIFTSGTTGAPKGAMTTHAQNIEVFRSFAAAIDLNEHDRYLIVNPFFHSFGYKAGWLSCLIAGAQIYPLAVFDPEKVMQIIEREKITVMPGAPTIFQSLLSHEQRSKFDLSSLNKATIGATTIPVDLIRDMRGELGIDHVYSAYGLTESCGVVSLCEKGDDFLTIAQTCGKALPGTEIKIVDKDGNPLPTGEEGEIWVRGFHVMQGYLDDQIATDATITEEGWLKTGDIGKLDAHRYLKITDRMKDMVIVGGFNCYPAEVEQILSQHPQITDVAVIGIPDDRLGEVTQAHIVAKGALSDAEVIDWAKQKMANYKVPRDVKFRQELPRNASGKIQKYLLCE